MITEEFMTSIYVQPVEDNNFTYDLEQHIFISKIGLIKDLGGEFQDDKIAERRSKKNAQLVYRFLLSQGASTNRAFVEWFLNCTKGGQTFVKECLKAQLEGDIASGMASNTSQNPIDFINGQHIDRKVILQNAVSPDVQMIFDISENYLGSKIFVQYTLGVALSSTRYEDWSY